MEPAHTHKWIDAAPPSGPQAPRHTALVDIHHVTDELFGFVNIPMAVWIDEEGTIVRPAEAASIQRSPLRDMDIPEGLPERMTRMLTEVKAIPDIADDYRAAIVDWAHHGAASRFVLPPEEVVARSVPRGDDEARAAACFELGDHLRRTVGHEAAVPWWREAHRLYPANWTYKRQAWTLVTTPEGEDNDLIQGPDEVYEGNWLDDVIAGGGGVAYNLLPDL
ncbi:MAG: hypothetical protein KDB06_07760 [Ilumatobacter sp.]|nr:hypothetical protein [Ilumatobacter sp.]